MLVGFFHTQSKGHHRRVSPSEARNTGDSSRGRKADRAPKYGTPSSMAQIASLFDWPTLCRENIAPQSVLEQSRPALQCAARRQAAHARNPDKIRLSPSLAENPRGLLGVDFWGAVGSREVARTCMPEASPKGLQHKQRNDECGARVLNRNRGTPFSATLDPSILFLGRLWLGADVNLLNDVRAHGTARPGRAVRANPELKKREKKWPRSCGGVGAK